MKFIKIALILLAGVYTPFMLYSSQPASAAAAAPKGYGKPLPPAPMLPPIGEVATQQLVPGNDTASAVTQDNAPSAVRPRGNTTAGSQAPSGAAASSASAASPSNSANSPRKASPLDALLAAKKTDADAKKSKDGQSAAGAGAAKLPGKRDSARFDPAVIQALQAGTKGSPKRSLDLIKYLKDNPAVTVDALKAQEKVYDVYAKQGKGIAVNFSETDPITRETPLMVAAYNLNLPVVQFLVEEKKVHLNDQDKLKNTAAHHILRKVAELQDHNKKFDGNAANKGPSEKTMKDLAEIDNAMVGLGEKMRTVNAAQGPDISKQLETQLDQMKKMRATLLAQEAKPAEELKKQIQQAEKIAVYLIKAIDKFQDGAGLTLENAHKKTPIFIIIYELDNHAIRRALMNTNAIAKKYAQSKAQVLNPYSDSDSSDDDEGDHRDRKRGGEGAKASGENQKTADKPKIDIFKAANQGNLPIVQTWIENFNANPNTPEPKKGRTVLMIAVRRHDAPLVNYLVNEAKVKANVDEVDLEGNTALHHALTVDHNFQTPQVNAANDAIINMLMKNTLKTKDIKNRQGNTPLHLAASAGKLEWVKKLVDDFADYKAKNDLKQTPVEHAQRVLGDLEPILTPENSKVYRDTINFLKELEQVSVDKK